MRKGRMTRLLALLLCGSLLLPVAVFASPGDGAEPLHTESVPEKEESGEEKREAAEKASPSELREETASGAAAAAGSASSVPSKAASPSELPGSASPSELPKGRAWSFSAFGLNAEAEGKNIGYSRSGSGALTEAGSSVTVWNLNNKGKLVPASTDGLSFYYTEIPAGQNFTLTATAVPEAWTFTNGQEGFGLMAADRVGTNGDGSAFWNNSYMATVTKLDYYYDAEKHEPTDDRLQKHIMMKLGIGSQEKIGVSRENLPKLLGNDSKTIASAFQTSILPLETSCGEKKEGTYNLIGREKGKASGTVEHPLEEVRLSIQKNNTGYFVSYIDAEGETHTNKYYEPEALSVLDADTVYVGFFAARSFKVNFSDIELQLLSPEEDEPKEEKPTVEVTPDYRVLSAVTANSPDYTFSFMANADGALQAELPEGGTKTVSVQADAPVRIPAKLAAGENVFRLSFTPDGDFHPKGKENYVLSDYGTKEFSHTVELKRLGEGDRIYVSRDGSPAGSGESASPVDIYTAFRFVQPGQRILLHSGTYLLDRTVVADRGIDGTEEAPILLEPAEKGGRAIFDFQEKCPGMIFAGNYWEVRDIDVRRSANGQKGIQISGSHNVFEGIRTYENGNTGIQISRYLLSDGKELWPSYDLILNCTSYANADSGHEDADGFAAKLTCGEGIVFDGCIAFNNADDGWDLFAKVETGAIGKVRIRNSLAFRNGYGLDGTEQGNGNGFKMGGSSISGRHELYNSAAYLNKAKGIDSNSCPDIAAYCSSSYENGGSNIAFYTNDAKRTAFRAAGLLSFRTESNTPETLREKELAGKKSQAKTAKEENLYRRSNFFWQDGRSANYDPERQERHLTADRNWFVSLEATLPEAVRPAQIDVLLRREDGRVDLGDFLRLSASAEEKLASELPEGETTGAKLDGQYDAVENLQELYDLVNGETEPEKPDKPEKEPEKPEKPKAPEDPKKPEKPEKNPERPRQEGKSSGSRSIERSSHTVLPAIFGGAFHKTAAAGKAENGTAVAWSPEMGPAQYAASATVLRTTPAQEKLPEAVRGSWQKQENGWRFLDSTGKPLTSGWQVLEWNGIKAWYSLDEAGYLRTGWYREEKGDWYYFSPLQDGSLGRMLTGRQYIEGKWYVFSDSGSLEG